MVIEMLINKTKKKIIIKSVKIADSFFKKFRELMLVSPINYALVFILGGETKIGAEGRFEPVMSCA